MSITNDENKSTQSVLSIVILLILYIFTGIFTINKIINPFEQGTYIENLEIIVAATASVMFGGVIGATVGGFGYFILEIIYRIIGIKTDPIGVIDLIYALGYSVGNLFVGWLAKSFKKKPKSLKEMTLNPKTWYNLVFNTITVLVGIGIISNLIIAVGDSSFTAKEYFNSFLPKFYFSSRLILTILPIILLIYNLVEVLRARRAKSLDKLYQKIKKTINVNGPAKITNIKFVDHGLQLGKWTPLEIRFKHTWDAPRSYQIESVSTSKIYPHLDTTSVLSNNEIWKHIIYVQALEQDHVDIRIRIHPAHKIKYKEKPKQQTDVNIIAKTYKQRDWLLIGVVVLSEVIITFFLFSILWSHISNILQQELLGSDVSSSQLNNIVIPWNLLLAIGLIETILFIPFLIIMYNIQKTTLPKGHDKILAFSQDIQTHAYENKPKSSLFNRIKDFFIVPLINILITISALYFSIRLFTISREIVSSGLIDMSITDLIYLTTLTILSWVLTLILLSNTSELFGFSKDIPIQSGKFITKVETLSQLKIHNPSQILFTVKNTSSKPGIRIAFESNGAISPPLIELHIDPGEVAYFMSSITPQGTGNQEILAIMYPLFDKDLNYLPIDECQPQSSQSIRYKVLGRTLFGITEGQGRTLRHIFGWGSLLTSTVALANEYVGIEAAIRQWQETFPFLATIQIPFLYLYYLFSNRFLTEIKTE